MDGYLCLIFHSYLLPSFDPRRRCSESKKKYSLLAIGGAPVQILAPPPRHPCATLCYLPKGSICNPLLDPLKLHPTDFADFPAVGIVFLNSFNSSNARRLGIFYTGNLLAQFLRRHTEETRVYLL